MKSDEILEVLLDALNAAGVAYMLTGSLASNVWGVVRSTKDADVVVQLGEGDLGRILTRMGPAFTLDPQSSFETITGTQRCVITMPRHAFKVELFLLTDDPHDRERFARRVRTNAAGRDAWVASAEDVIITKLRWSLRGNRSKDLDDAIKVAKTRAERLDWNYIRSWCERHGALERLDAIRASLPT